MRLKLLKILVCNSIINLYIMGGIQVKKADFNYNFNFSRIESVTYNSIFRQMENVQKIASTIKPNFEITIPKTEPLNLGLNYQPKIHPNITTSALKMVRNIRVGLQSDIMPSVLEIVRNVTVDMQSYITPDIINMLSTLSELDINELQLYWEDEEVQEIIDGELFAADQEIDQLSIIQQLNNWAIKVLDYPSSLKERSPFIFLVLTIVMSLSSLVVIPVVQDVIKEKVWHLSDYLEGTKEEPIRKQTKIFKTRVIKDDKVASEISYSDALRSMGYVRITNRKTDVFQSGQRKSGKIDTIQPNKPVIVLHKKKNWSLVMYQDDNKQELEGWVFTKNLIK